MDLIWNVGFIPELQSLLWLSEYKPLFHLGLCADGVSTHSCLLCRLATSLSMLCLSFFFFLDFPSFFPCGLESNCFSVCWSSEDHQQQLHQREHEHASIMGLSLLHQDSFTTRLPYFLLPWTHNDWMFGLFYAICMVSSLTCTKTHLRLAGEKWKPSFWKENPALAF